MFDVMIVRLTSHTTENGWTAEEFVQGVTCALKSVRSHLKKNVLIITGVVTVWMLGVDQVAINGEKITLCGKVELTKLIIDECVLKRTDLVVSIVNGRLLSLANCLYYLHTISMRTGIIISLKILDQCAKPVIKILNILQNETQKVGIAELKSRNKAGTSYKLDNPNRRLEAKTSSQGQRIGDETTSVEYNSPTRPRHSVEIQFEKICWTVPIAKMKVQKQRIKSHCDNKTIPYGSTAPTIVQKNPEAFPVDMSIKERERKIQAIIDIYFSLYRGVYDYMQGQIRIAKKRGYLRSLFGGRKRRLDMTWFDSRWAAQCRGQAKDVAHIENEARNAQIQIFASHMLTVTTRKTYDLIEASNVPALRILMTIHDQLLFNCHKDYIDEGESIIRLGMETVLRQDSQHRYDMPLSVDFIRQRWWNDGQYKA